MTSRYVKVGVQSDLKTAATTLTAVRGVEVNFSADHNVVYLDSLDGYCPYDAIFGAHSFKGSMTVYAIKNHINPILHAILGVETSVGDPATEYEYTLGDPKALTIEYGTEHNKALKAVGAIVNSVRATLEPKDVVKLECDLIIREVLDATYSSTTPSAGKPFIVGKTTVTVDGNVYSVKTFELNIERNISDDEYVIGDCKLSDIVYGETKIHGRITLLSSDYTEFYRALFGSPSATSPQTELTPVNITITTRTPDGADYMTIELPSVVYPTGEVRARGKEPMDKTLEWRLVGDGIKITVKA